MSILGTVLQRAVQFKTKKLFIERAPHFQHHLLLHYIDVLDGTRHVPSCFHSEYDVSRNVGEPQNGPFRYGIAPYLDIMSHTLRPIRTRPDQFLGNNIDLNLLSTRFTPHIEVQYCPKSKRIDINLYFEVLTNSEKYFKM